jgi:hypothetical protein
MKLTYWVATNRQDARCYDLRAKTRKECVRMVQEQDHAQYEPPQKVTLEYRDAFDLVTLILQEGGPAETY